MIMQTKQIRLKYCKQQLISNNLEYKMTYYIINILNSANLENCLFMFKDLKWMFQKQQLCVIPNKKIEIVFRTHIAIFSVSFMFIEKFAEIIQKGIKNNRSQLLSNKRKNTAVFAFKLKQKVNDKIMPNKAMLHTVTKQGLNSLKIELQIKVNIGISESQIQDSIMKSSIKQIGMIKY
ncbi:unnamed protein product [Paramecium octaurelia]|uniref:Uncharacterized protein n=1 Tax=Paramecium octaurelia TaxID=43137 RepID=A0A8S1Y835_PAROT|nr:unnamed protein product [Paramecium octaurelia]